MDSKIIVYWNYLVMDIWKQILIYIIDGIDSFDKVAIKRTCRNWYELMKKIKIDIPKSCCFKFEKIFIGIPKYESKNSIYRHMLYRQYGTEQFDISCVKIEEYTLSVSFYGETNEYILFKVNDIPTCYFAHIIFWEVVLNKKSHYGHNNIPKDYNSPIREIFSEINSKPHYFGSFQGSNQGFFFCSSIEGLSRPQLKKN